MHHLYLWEFPLSLLSLVSYIMVTLMFRCSPDTTINVTMTKFNCCLWPFICVIQSLLASVQKQQSHGWCACGTFFSSCELFLSTWNMVQLLFFSERVTLVRPDLLSKWAMPLLIPHLPPHLCPSASILLPLVLSPDTPSSLAHACLSAPRPHFLMPHYVLHHCWCFFMTL